MLRGGKSHLRQLRQAWKDTPGSKKRVRPKGDPANPEDWEIKYWVRVRDPEHPGFYKLANKFVSLYQMNLNTLMHYSASLRKGRRNPREVQALLFDRDSWTVTRAKKWIKQNGYKHPKLHTTKNYFRFRQTDPSEFAKGSFRTVDFGDGIKGIVAKRTVRRNPDTNFTKIIGLMAQGSVADARQAIDLWNMSSGSDLCLKHHSTNFFNWVTIEIEACSSPTKPSLKSRKELRELLFVANAVGAKVGKAYSYFVRGKRGEQLHYDEWKKAEFLVIELFSRGELPEDYYATDPSWRRNGLPDPVTGLKVELVPTAKVRLKGFPKSKVAKINKLLVPSLRAIERMADHALVFPSPIYPMTKSEIAEGRKTVDSGHPEGAGHGVFYPDYHIVKVNPTMSWENILANVIHENLHFVFPRATEHDVDDMTAEITEEILGYANNGAPPV